MKTILIGLLAGVIALLGISRPIPCQADSLAADSVKAGFVYNFTKFVEWPAGALPQGGTLQLCVVGQALEGKLNPLNGRQSQGREIRVRNLSASSDLTGCHILYIAASEERRLNSILGAVSGYPVLTISDIDEFPDYGGMIGLNVQSEKVNFAVNLANTRAVGLKLSAQLLRLGRVVQ
jgi:hypothetical protein